MKIVKKKSTENCHFYSREKSLYIAWECFRNATCDQVVSNCSVIGPFIEDRSSYMQDSQCLFSQRPKTIYMCVFVPNQNSTNNLCLSKNKRNVTFFLTIVNFTTVKIAIFYCIGVLTVIYMSRNVR